MIGALLLRGGHSAQPWELHTQNVVDAGLLCAGLQLEQALALVGRVFSLCRAAHVAASTQAMGLAALPTCSRVATQDEILQDHALALLVTLPAQLGMPPERESLSRVLQNPQAGQDVARELTGSDTPIATMDGPAFTAWLASGRIETAAFLPRLFNRCQVVLEGVGGVVDMPALTPQAVQAWLAHDHTQAGSAMAYDASIWPDYVAYPVMQALVGREGVTPFARLVARLLELLACLAGRGNALSGRAGAFQVGLGQGVGVARAARGMLVHAAQLRNGLVTDYQILSPTFWHVARGGLFRQGISRLRPGCAKVSVACVLAAFNPCVPVSVEGMHHA